MDNHEAASFRVGHRKVPRCLSTKPACTLSDHAGTSTHPGLGLKAGPFNSRSNLHLGRRSAASTAGSSCPSGCRQAAESIGIGCRLPWVSPAGPTECSLTDEPKGCSRPDPPHGACTSQLLAAPAAEAAPTSRGFADVHVWDLPTGALTAAHLLRARYQVLSTHEYSRTSTHELPIAEVSVRSTCFLASLSVLSNS